MEGSARTYQITDGDRNIMAINPDISSGPMNMSDGQAFINIPFTAILSPPLFMLCISITVTDRKESELNVAVSVASLVLLGSLPMGRNRFCAPPASICSAFCVNLHGIKLSMSERRALHFLRSLRNMAFLSYHA